MARARGRTPLLTEPTRNGQHFDLDSADGRRCARAHAQSSPVCLKGHKPHSKKVPGKKNRQICECYCPRDQLPQELDAETERHRSGGVWCPELDSTRTFSSAIETKVKTDMEEEIGRTLVQVISEKYNEDNFPYRRGAGVVIHTSPQGSSVTDRLNLPSVLVLENCGIIHAGDEEEVAAFCAHVVELDLSFNKFRDWGEIIKILSNIPHLDFLNLSMNPLSSSLEPVGAEAFSSLRCLVLNNTHISWNMVHMLTREIPELEELFLCLNEYKCVSMSPIPCPSLRLLHITDNQLHDWGEVRKLGLLYPHLTSLILANNSLSSINEPEDSLQCLFSNLHSINLHNSRLNGWEDIEKLNFFPKLCEVHLMGIPLLQPYTDQERRYLAIAHLPSVTVLNGSVVTDGEREDAERFYIRYHLDSPEDELPQRFHNLVAHYGCMAPLADVDLRPLSCAQVELHFGDNTKKLEIRLKQTVADLKKQLRPVVQLPVNKTRVYYIDRQMGYALAPQELKYGARALHSYNIQDGDEILVVPKSH